MSTPEQMRKLIESIEIAQMEQVDIDPASRKYYITFWGDREGDAAEGAVDIFNKIATSNKYNNGEDFDGGYYPTIIAYQEDIANLMQDLKAANLTTTDVGLQAGFEHSQDGKDYEEDLHDYDEELAVAIMDFAPGKSWDEVGQFLLSQPFWNQA